MRLRSAARAFRDDRRGFAAVEFALILPVLLLFALGVTEVGRFVLLGIKAQHAADTVADLAAGTSGSRGRTSPTCSALSGMSSHRSMSRRMAR